MVTIGAAYVEVLPETDGRFGRDVADDIERQTEGPLKKSAGRLGSAFGTAIKVGAGAALAGGLVAGKILSDSIQAASDLGETVSKTQAVFGTASEDLIAYAATAVESTGQSKRAFLDYTSGFGLLLKEIGGQSEAAAAKQATDLATLTADLASFFNRSTEDVAGAISSALTGEFESLKSFGVVINDARLQAKALELGLSDGTGALDAQAKQLATLALIYESTGDAQGDFLRTSDALANQQRILSAQWENAKATLGEQFLPVAVTVANFLSKNLPGALAVASQAFAPLLALIDGLQGQRPDAGGFLGFVQSIGLSLRGFFEQVSRFSEGFVTLRAAFTEGDDFGADGFAGVMNQIGLTLRSFVGFVTDVALPAIVGFVRTLIEVWKRIAPEVLPVLGELASTVAAVVELIVAVVRRFVQIVGPIWERWGDDILDVVVGVFSLIAGIIGGALKVIQGIIRTVTAIINGDWSAAWDGILLVFSGLWQAVEAILVAAWAIIRALFRAGLNAVAAVWGGAWDAVVAVAAGAWRAVVSAATAQIDAVRAAIGSGVERIRSLWSTAWTTVRTTVNEAWNNVRATVTDGANAIVDRIRELPGRLTSAARGMWNGLTAGLRDVVNGAIDLINRLIDAYNRIPGIPDISRLSKVGATRITSGGSVTRLARGGLAFEEMVAIVGDNPGARYDPEITTPTSHMIDAVMTAIERSPIVTGARSSAPAGDTINVYTADNSPAAIARAVARRQHLRRQAWAPA